MTSIKRVALLFDPDNPWLSHYFDDYMSDDASFEIIQAFDQRDAMGMDIVFILGYTKILSSKFLISNQFNFVIHESNLPEGRGFSPVQWQILEGKDEIPVRLIEASETVDSGDIILEDSIQLNGLELYPEIRAKQAAVSMALITRLLKIFPNFDRKKQIGAETHYRKRTHADGELNIERSIRAVFNQLRIGNNDQWPSFFYYGGKKYILKIYSDDSE